MEGQVIFSIVNGSRNWHFGLLFDVVEKTEEELRIMIYNYFVEGEVEGGGKWTKSSSITSTRQERISKISNQEIEV